MRELAIQAISGLAGGMIAVVFVRFVHSMVQYLRQRDWELW